MMPVDAGEYAALVSTLAEEHPDEIAADATHVASSAIAGIDRRADPANGYVRTHGTSEYTEATLYPSDVVAHSEQPQPRVDRHYADGSGRGSVHDRTEVYAIHTLALDLLDAVRNRSDIVAVCEDCGDVFESVDAAEGHTDVYTCSNLTDLRGDR